MESETETDREIRIVPPLALQAQPTARKRARDRENERE